jgi:hypothetical protein
MLEQRIRWIVIWLFALLNAFMGGYVVHRQGYFPAVYIENVAISIKEKLKGQWYYKNTNDSTRIVINTPEALDWPILLTSIGDNDSLIVKVIKNDGSVIHKWNIEWFDYWDNSDHLHERVAPKERPGTHIHGIHLFDDGSIVFNFEHCGLARVDAYGALIWKLPISSDHSVFFDGSIIWVCAQRYHDEPMKNYPNFIAPFIEHFVVKISTDGKILDELSVLELMYNHNLEGLLYNTNQANEHTKRNWDVLHLNDVEPFPEGMASGFFSYQDVMISLRNINTIIIYNDSTKIIKDVITGGFVRQHDPDFIDGNHISIFDNYNIGSSNPSRQSRILIKSYLDNQISEYYKGSEDNPFNTNIMGKHQWLENGNLLITESMQGRAFEVNPKKEIVWEYRNVVGGTKLGLLEEATRVSPEKVRSLLERKSPN